MRALLLMLAWMAGPVPARAQTSPIAARFGINTDSSAIGAPLGDTAKATIGPEGGRILSKDGLAELLFPPGAVMMPTEIGIQAIENTGAGCMGNTYACTPDGMQFQKPVKLTIHFGDSVAKHLSPTFHIIRWQDSKGHWSTLENTTVDPATGSIAGLILHFTGYSDASQWIFFPQRARVRLGNEQLFGLETFGGLSKTDQTLAVEWFVNGIQGGNEEYGFIKKDPETPLLATYTAPKRFTISPYVSCHYTGSVNIGKSGTANDPRYGALATLYEDYHYLFYGSNKIGLFHMIDSATCTIRVMSFGSPTMTEITNPDPWSDWPTEERSKKCRLEYPTKKNWKGMVQLAGMSPGSGTLLEDGSFHVMLNLHPAMGSTPLYIEHCKTTRTIRSNIIPAEPFYIEFTLLTDGNIRISYKGKEGINMLDGMDANDEGAIIKMYRKP